MKRLTVIISSLLLLGVFLSDSYAQDINRKIDTLSRKIDHLSSRIDTLSRKIDTLYRKGDTSKVKGDMRKIKGDSLKVKNDKPNGKDNTKIANLKFRGMLFSDFVGLNDDQPNGLIQTNFYFSYERPYDTLRYPSLVPFYNIVLLDFTFSKLENEIYQLPVRYVNADLSNGYLNRLDLLQYANMKAMTKINLATCTFPKKANLYFDIIGGFYRTAISDSLKLSNVENLMTGAVGVNVKVRTVMDPKTKFSADLSYCYLIPHLFSNTYKEMGGQQYIEHPGNIPQDFVDEEMSGISIVDLIIRHGESEETQQFLRISFCGNYFSKMQNTPNIFYQLQLGINWDLSKVFEGKEGKGGNADQQNKQKSK